LHPTEEFRVGERILLGLQRKGGASMQLFRKRNSMLLAACLLVALLWSVLISGCGGGPELQKAKVELAGAQKEKDNLSNQVKSLEEENTKLKAKIEEQIESIGALKRRMTDAGIAETPEEGNFDACKENLKKIAQALKMYSSDNKGLFPKKLEKICPDPRYLEFIPTCPSVSKDTYSAGYEVSEDRKAYTVSCLGKNHEKLFIKENYPEYSSVLGVLVEKEERKEPSEEEEEASPSPSPSASEESTPSPSPTKAPPKAPPKKK
jgi:hypothetical protein